VFKFPSFCFLFFINLTTYTYSQEIAFGNLAIDDYLKRRNLSTGFNEKTSWMLRTSSGSSESLFFPIDSVFQNKMLFSYNLIPVYSTLQFDDKRPYVGGEYGIVPARGAQGYFSTGIQARFSILNIQLQPEIVTAQNLPFLGFSGNFSSNTISDRFYYWNVGDSPERFGNSTYSKLSLGQSSISLRGGAFELAVGTKNYWWGPGQWNSLIFSNNAPGFPHISINTTKLAKTFLGDFEGQVLIGKLRSSNQYPTQIEDNNVRYFSSLNQDFRYLNALLLSYSPNWVPGITFGYARTFQYYNSERPDDFGGWFPIFEPMAKEKLLTNGNAVSYDGRRQSQQIAIFTKYIFPIAKAEIYFQFGRRDHALNWREFILNPEHARAYQIGFIKLANLFSIAKMLQIRGEITHQQESVNRNLRYDVDGGNSWHTHGHVRGFTNFGQPMGVGIGTGSNVQTLEVSLVEDWNKLGILFERLENNQDFYYRAFGQQDELKPWIDWSAALLWNTSYKDLFLSARLQGTFGRNYQWGLTQKSTPEFPVSQNLFSVHSQVNLIYFWNRSFAIK
jgi:hypothetical protein